MKQFMIRLLVSVLILFTINNIKAQVFGERSFYLVDSLLITELGESDIELLDTCLKKYHLAKDDTTRILNINYISNLMHHPDWMKYQNFQFKLIKNALKKENSSFVVSRLTKYLVGTLNNLAYIKAESGQKQVALKCYKQILTIDYKTNDKEGMVTDFNNIGSMYHDLGYPDKALKNYSISASLANELGKEREHAAALNNIASIYRYKGDNVNAVEYYLKAMSITEKIGDEERLAAIYNLIGLFYKEQGEFDIAKQYFFKGLKMKEKLKDLDGLVSTYGNIAGYYSAIDKNDSALIYNERALELSIKLNMKHSESTIYSNIGNLYHKKNDTKRALEYYFKSFEMEKKLENREGISRACSYIASVYDDIGDFKNALEYGKKSYKLNEEIGMAKGLKFSASILSRIYKNLGDYKNALLMKDIYYKMNDSINSIENINAVAKMNFKFEYDKKNAVNEARFESQLALEKEAKEKQMVLKYAFIIGSGMLLMFLIVVYNRLKITKSQKKIIEVSRKELEQKNVEILDSISYAKRIQNAILPPGRIVKNYLPNSFILYLPKDIVAGDFYWMETNGETVLFAAADCTGHGVPGAMVSVICNNGLNRSVREHKLTDPGEILDKTSEIIIQEFEKSDDEVKDGMDISLCSLNTNSNELKWSGANNPIWIIKEKSNEKHLIEIKADKQPIGRFIDPKPFTTHTLQLAKGDSVYVFTDGFQDQFGGENGKKFKASKMKELILSVQDKRMDQQKEIIHETFNAWKGNLEQVDDVCVIGIKL